MGNEENYKNLENVMQKWANPDGFHKKGLFFNKNTCEALDFSLLKQQNIKISDADNIFLLTK